MLAARLDAASFEQLVAEMRPGLHRYCARMLGSAFEGEDVVQDALIKASQSLASAGDIERPKGWLFRIAHNAALDALRRRRRRLEVPFDAETSNLTDAAEADGRVAATASLATFLALPATQRSCVVLVDVLGYLPAETAAILGLTLPAVKAALHRGRLRLREIAGLVGEPPTALSARQRQRLQDYADRFNARDFDALRDLLAEDVRLDLANRRRLDGKADVSVYFTRYDSASDWRFSVGVAENRLALLVRNPKDASSAITHVVLLDWAGGKIAHIRDFKYAPYVMERIQISEP
jgi:RNA polymerase sigma-70 factor, ECF subfamily